MQIAEAETGQSLTKTFAAACAEFAARGLPETARRRTALISLDTLGAMLSASRPVFPGTERLAEFVTNDAAGGKSTVVGTTVRASLTDAALMNGYLGYALDIESHHGAAVVHAAAAVVPAALGLAERTGASGEATLTAVALGIDVACRVSLAIGPNDLYNRGFHPTSIGGTFGAVAAASALLGLDAESFERVFGLAATQTCGLLAWQSDETEESRPFNPGLAARNGVTAAELVRLGFGAPLGIFDPDAKYNVFRAWSHHGAGLPGELLDRFGERFLVDELIIKRHACCAFLHPGVDGLLDILTSADVASDRIASITIRFPRTGAPIIDANPLRSHRAQYILPVAATRGRVDFADVIHDRSDEPGIRRLAAATTFIRDDELDPLYPERYTTVLDITTTDGETHRRRVDWALGTPERPMTDDEIVAKFRQLAGDRIEPAHVDRLVDLVMNLGDASRIEPLLEALRVEG